MIVLVDIAMPSYWLKIKLASLSQQSKAKGPKSKVQTHNCLGLLRLANYNLMALSFPPAKAHLTSVKAINVCFNTQTYFSYSRKPFFPDNSFPLCLMFILFIKFSKDEKHMLNDLNSCELKFEF